MKHTFKKPAGLILFAAAILIQRFLPSSPGFDFLAGLFTGLSLVLILSTIFNFTRKAPKAISHQ